MKPISPVIPGLEPFEIKIAEDQPEYETLPALKLHDGTLVTRWRLTWRERLVALFNGDIYLHVWTFGKPLQPVYLEVDEPAIIVTSNPTQEAAHA